MLGSLLRPVRAGGARSLWLHPGLRAEATIEVSSADFEDGGPLPAWARGEGVGENRSPELSWTGVPRETVAQLLVIDDVDAPTLRPMLHTLAVLGPGVRRLPTGALSAGAPDLRFLPTPLGAGYRGPRPLPGHGRHHYGIAVYAVADPLRPGPANSLRSRRKLLRALQGKILARGRIIGTDER